MAIYVENYRKWLSSGKLSSDELTELKSIADDEKEIKERFAVNLSFGTAGLRGIMKLGTNAMNVYTVAQATQGLASFIVKSGRANNSVVVG